MRSIVLFLALAAAAAGANLELLVNGADEVYILDLATRAKVFSWRAAGHPEIPAALVPRFRTTDDSKPVSRGRILITSSSGAVALVDRADGRPRFWARTLNAHSAELLPGDRIVVACSSHAQGGDRLVLFDARTPEKELFSTPLVSAHGVVWDARRNLLWALGHDDVRVYRLTDGPALVPAGSWALPSPGGHELSPADSTNSKLVVSALEDVWLFDCETKRFERHPALGGTRHLKSASLHPETGEWAYTQADLPDWWTDKLRFTGPTKLLTRPGERLYKVRWVARLSGAR
jgi:hypothetical protein